MADKVANRFQELVEQADHVAATANQHGTIRVVDSEVFITWKVKVKSLVSRVCGGESQHFIHLIQAENSSPYTAQYDNFSAMKAVLLATKDDYEGGHLSTLRTLVQAEVFDSELEQASELLRSGYKTAAGVIAGTVLETSLRELCTRNSLPHGKLDRMNADLAKQGLYNANMAKRITALAGIRNSASHGKPDEFTDAQVKAMIEDIERFLAQYLS
jgi:hypothetical protein